MPRKVGFRPEGFRPDGSRRRVITLMEESNSRKLNFNDVINSYNHGGELIDPETGEIIEMPEGEEDQGYSFKSRNSQ